MVNDVLAENTSSWTWDKYPFPSYQYPHHEIRHWKNTYSPSVVISFKIILCVSRLQWVTTKYLVLIYLYILSHYKVIHNLWDTWYYQTNLVWYW